MRAFFRWLICELFHPWERVGGDFGSTTLGRCKHPRCGRLVFMR